jgi:hypothetical protein
MGQRYEKYIISAPFSDFDAGTDFQALHNGHVFLSDQSET